MTVLITGGAGYIGSHTCLELIEKGHNVVIVDNMSGSRAECVSRLRRISGVDIPVYWNDLQNEEQLDKIFTEYEIDCVLHIAALKGVGESILKPLVYYRNNLQSTMTLCEVMEKHDVKKLIFSSSASVYSNENEMPITEKSTTGNCSTPYGWTKYMCEQILTDIAAAGPDWSVIILRYFNPIGAHASGDIGEDLAGMPSQLLSRITQTVLGKFETMPVYGTDYPTPDGTCLCDYTHVTDIAKGHSAAVAYSREHKGAEVFNLGTGRGVSVFEVIKAFESVTGVIVPKTLMSRRPGDLPAVYTTTDKAANILNWCAEKTIEDGCADSWRWHSKNPEGYGF